MKNKLMRTLALAALLSALGVGAAQATEGWYGRVDVGYTVDGEIELDDADFDLEDDWMADVGVGYGFMGGFRGEAELAYRNNDIDLIDDEVEVWSLMANLFYDFNRGGRFQPYLGVGAGFAQLETLGEDEDSWGWQGLAGVGIELSDRATLDIGYRYFVLEDLQLFGIDSDYEHQAVTVGLRWEFGAAAPPPPPPLPPPPPPPPPPPVTTCPTSDFVVYFEWDRSNLNQAALETIDSAVARARECNVGSVVVVGHTDTSGSTQYNVGLSERRAGVVRDALVARGISASSIRTEARGENDLARPTNDGVREPLNRRTAVTISFQ
ncbi:MAG TPA: outer membrane beta-barrel protein [Candidatus Binatia bacterium]|nr:outer membrane beta-barrel protein [Candidatus Binatia bacterium]